MSIFLPPGCDLTPLGKEYLERRITCLTEVIDRQEWRHEDGEAGKPEYWIGRLHEAKITLANLSAGLERRRDGFGKVTDQQPSK